MTKREKFLRKFLEKLPAFQAVFRMAEAKGIINLEGHWKEPILDIGCGDGIFSEILLGKGKQIIGVDLDEIALKEARKRKVYKKLIKCNAKNLPFSSNSFASVLANSSLEHIENLEPVLKEIYRVLTKGGIFILSVPSEKRAKYFIFGEIENRFFKHLNCWSGKTWSSSLKRIGFKQASYQYAGSLKICRIGDLLLPFGLIGFFERKVFGRYLAWRKYFAPLSFLLLRGVEDKIENENGAIIVVRAEK